MVLSNKKLKQKLREAKAESLAANESGELYSEGNQSAITPEGNSRLQVLLEAAKKKGRLSKTEKRRKTLFVEGLDTDNKSLNEDNGGADKIIEDKRDGDLVGEDDHGENGEKDKKKKKGESEEKGLVEDGVVREAKKPKKNKKKKKKAKTVEEKIDVEAEKVADETKEISKSHTNEHVAAKVYVGGIPYYSTEDDIRSYFETEAAAKWAVALDLTCEGGFYLKIQPYRTTRASKVSDFAPKLVEGYNRIYVGNLSWDITEDDLRKFFSDCNISSIRWGTDKETGEFRAYAHVDFLDNLSLLIALKLDQRIVCGRPIKISCAVPMKGTKIHATAARTASSNEAESRGLNTNAPAHADMEKEADNGGSNASIGKIRRRTCYECGEKGHISTACPKRQSAETNSNPT